MPKHLDRATRTLVTQYGNETAVTGPPPDFVETRRKDAAPKAIDALVRLLDACNEAEKNAARGRIPMVTAHWIRKQITEALDG